MTRKEKDLKVLESLDLKVGDKIKINSLGTFKIVENKTNIGVLKLATKDKKVEYSDCYYNVCLLIVYDWEKVELSLKDKKCEDFYSNHCAGCPFRKRKALYCICIDDHEQMTLEEIYNIIKQEADIVKEAIFGGEE